MATRIPLSQWAKQVAATIFPGASHEIERARAAFIHVLTLDELARRASMRGLQAPEVAESESADLKVGNE